MHCLWVKSYYRSVHILHKVMNVHWEPEQWTEEYILNAEHTPSLDNGPQLHPLHKLQNMGAERQLP